MSLYNSASSSRGDGLALRIFSSIADSIGDSGGDGEFSLCVKRVPERSKLPGVDLK